jgi:hypothetical protein
MGYGVSADAMAMIAELIPVIAIARITDSASILK